MNQEITLDDPRISTLRGGDRLWWDVSENKKVLATTVYLPQGCPDWGEKGGKRNELCTFCMLPNAVAGYREAFYEGRAVPRADQRKLFEKTFELSTPPVKNVHTVMIFNAGSFLAEIANAPEIQQAIMEKVATHPTIKRVVIESRAELITDKTVEHLVKILEPAQKKLTVRIGIETQDDHLRLKVLKKGHTRKQLHEAVRVLKKHSVTSGGYVLLNPAPELDPEWAIAETEATLDWVLKKGPEGLEMNEAYFCSTNVGPGTPLTLAWQQGSFRPASLWMVLKVLHYASRLYDGRVHLLPFKDEPELLAVPSNHVPAGIPESLAGAMKCDRAFHAMLDRYRETQDMAVLAPPECDCKPEWF